MKSFKEWGHRVRVRVARKHLRFRVGYRFLRVRMANEYRRADLFRAQGARIGSGCRLLIHDLGSEPYLISIGDETLVSSGVTFVTHDGGTWAIKDLEDGPVNRYGRITIGSRCFIGTGSILLPGVTIGDRAVVGAGSVVTKDVAAGTVVVGVPARFICALDEYRAKCAAESLPDLDTSTKKAKRGDLERRLFQASDQPLNGAEKPLQ